MKCLNATAKALIGLAVLTAMALPAMAATMMESIEGTAMIDGGAKPEPVETERDETCAAADGKELCKTMPGFPPLDMATSLFSAMTGCSRSGM